MPRTTLKELAALLHLAPSTVSRALQGYPDISEATRQRVKALARQLKYRPSVMAAGLRSRTFRLIAVVIPDLTDVFYLNALQGILESAYEKNYRILLYESQENYQNEANICHSLEKSGMDGLLISPSRTTSDSTHIKKLKAEGYPVVFFGRLLGDVDTDRVLGDDYSGAYDAVSYLIRQGCRKIAHLAAPQHWLWAQKRQIGYMQALRDHHIPVNREAILEYTSPENIKNTIEKLIIHYPIDGLFAAEDKYAAQVLVLLQQLNYKIPQEISVCGYGNEVFSRFTSPQLTTVETNGRVTGRKAIELLIRQLEDTDYKETRTVLLKNELIIRDSTLH